MKRVLLRRRETLRQSVSLALQEVLARDEASVGDAGDAAVDTDYREINSRLVEAESRELDLVERALERMREGRYGKCEDCAKQIPARRLQALPYATACIRCQRRQEQPRAEKDGEALITEEPRIPQLLVEGGWSSCDVLVRSANEAPRK
jgi:DnaK suppressor protein